MGWHRIHPRVQVDPFGTLLLPGILLLPVLFGNFVFPVFAYAKPMPLNPWTLRRRDRDLTVIALAGPAANVGLAFAVGVLLRVAPAGELRFLLQAVVIASVFLAVINVVPIPGLDGAKVVGRFLTGRAREVYAGLDQYLALFVLVIFFIFSGPIFRFVDVVASGVCRLAAGAAGCA
jgi:Zn-dependent protease